MRRLILGTVVACIACSGGTSAPHLARIAPIQSELTRDEQIAHALSRLSYGARPGDIDLVRRVGLERWIALQLTPERIKDPAGDSAVASYESLATPTNELTAAFREVRMARRDTTRRGEPAIMQSRRDLQMAVNEVGSAKLARAVVSERQLYEQMVDFWENHFSVFVGKGQTRLFIPSYDRDVIRPLALGRFRDLLGAVAQSPAMLFYLDNAQSGADSTHRTLAELGRSSRRPFAGRRRPGLNENYARELMELHTLGVDGGYTQQDVIEVARALTGWSIDQAAGAFVFRPAIHDADEKMVLGSRLEAGRGIEDGEQVLDILARHPSTARFITRKLAVRFVSDSAPPELVSRCAAVFTKTDGDIRQVVQCVVTSPEFFSKRAYRAKVKTPFEVVASALRAAEATPDGSPRATQIVARLGQPIFGRQTPDGWPDRAEEWVNAGAMVNRVNFGLSLAQGRAPGVRLKQASLDKSVASLLSSPEFQRR
ncbi:MAG TPA: DUF1800 domain-containing protein [Gemmatimonadaceae bacterium]|nr:DUF1800 domain-containing protein [Gemmatimonadaceae bacterium]